MGYDYTDMGKQSASMISAPGVFIYAEKYNQ
jgi:hypothetical protein